MNFRFIILTILLNTAFSFSQKNESSIYIIESFFNDIQELNVSNAEKKILAIKNENLKKRIKIYFNLIQINGFKNHTSREYIDSIVLESENNDLLYLLDLLIITEDEIHYKTNRVKAFDIAVKGFKLSEELKIDFLKKEFLLKILNIYKKGILNSDTNVHFYLDKLFELSKKKPTYLFKYYLIRIYLNEIGLLKGDSKIKFQKTKEITDYLMSKIDSLSNKINDSNKLKIEYYHIKGLNSISNNNQDSFEYFIKELHLLNEENHIYFNKYKYENLKELARCLSLSKNYSEAISYLNKAKKYQSEITLLRNSFVYNLYVSDIHFGLNEKDSAFITLKKAFQNSFMINFINQNNLISSLEVKNKTAQKEKQILIEQQKNKQRLNLLIGSLLFILLGGTIGVLSLKNSKRKRKLAEQQKELEAQKNLTLIKEQELTTINAMVEGQEKERKRVAEDLHDNLGSVLATLKLHFENLKINNKKKKIDQETLFNKTEGLIDEAYLKVRSIAHAKNAGVIANQGLLTAVKMMAEKISSADKIKIEVIDFGLHERVDNSLEISVFRIIQELVTNIIKHAEAKNATINISLYDKNLNIIIEDDGKGFDIKKVNLKNGMGINSIKTRIAHLKGTFEIDATIGKGSSVIIDIPVE